MANGNGNGNGWKTKSGVKSFQMFVADIMGNASELLFLRFQDKFDNALPFLKTAFKSIAYYPVKAFQKPLEYVLDHTQNFEGQKNYEERMKKTPDERLDGLLDTSYHYTSALAVGYGALVGTERGLSKMMRSDHVPTGVWWCVDMPVHVGLVALMSMPFMHNNTDKIKNTVKNVMETLGWSKQKAEQDARLATVYILPNYATWASTSAVMAGLHYAEHSGITKVNKGFFKNIADIAKHLGIGPGRSH